MNKQVRISNDQLFVVIPVHNRKEYTRGCLESLKRQAEQNFKIIVVDDGSTDGTEEMIRNEFPCTIVLRGDGNLWWTRSINLGVQEALSRGADYILTLNDDTVAPPDFICGLLNAAKANPGALIGASAIDIETGDWIYGGERIDWLRVKSVKLLDVLTPDERHGLHEVTHFPGRGLLVPVAVYREVGLYNQKYFPHGMADNDFTLHAARAGHKVYCDFDVKLQCIPGESYGVKLVKNRNRRNYYQHLFDIKGGGNLKFFIYYALRNCPRRYLPVFLPVGLLRRTLGYWLH
jgi:GT2 family glycosyltransferase